MGLENKKKRWKKQPCHAGDQSDRDRKKKKTTITNGHELMTKSCFQDTPTRRERTAHEKP
jgi:hypothetical protein